MTVALSTRKHQRIEIWVALVTVYLVWGSSFLGIRFAIESIPPFLMGGTRSLIAGAALYAWRRARGDAAPTLAQWRSAIIIGVALMTLSNGAIVWSEQWVPSGIAALLNATVPLWMILIDAFRRGGCRPTRQSVVGLLTGFFGVSLLIGTTQQIALAGPNLVGAVVLVLGALCWSMGSLYSRDADLPDSPILGTSMELLAGGTGLLLAGTLAGEWQQLAPSLISARSIAAWAYLIVFGSGLAFIAYTWLLRNAPTPLVSTYAYVNPAVAVLLGYTIGAESLTATVVVAAVLIVGSVIVTTRGQAAR